MYGSVRTSSRSSPRTLEIGQFLQEGDPSVAIDQSPKLVHHATLLGRAFILIGVTLAFAVATVSQSWWMDGGSLTETDLSAMPDATLKVTDSVSTGTLQLEAINEYGTNDVHALALYGLDMVIEPFRDTTIRVVRSTAPESTQTETKYWWRMFPVNGDEMTPGSPDVMIDSYGGSHLRVKLKQPGRSYSLIVQQVQGKDVVAEGRAMVACKYLRRELRELTESDREDFFEAMRIFYMTSSEEARQKYGEGFSNSVRLAATHNSKSFCYHGGMHFPLAHAAFNLMLERSLQMVNPKISLPSWDFMVESGTMGTEWPRSTIFSHEWFGSAFGKAKNSYQIEDGWIGNISTIYDPEGKVLGDVISPEHNAYGFITQSYDYTDLMGVTRTHSFCGMRGEVVFTQCGELISCFEDSENLYEWTYCMESQVHASMHGLLGGGFNCNVDMEKFLEEHPEFSRGLLTFVLEYFLANVWPGNKLMKPYNSCDETCAHGQEGSCGCTCLTNPFDWTHEEVRDFMTESMESLQRTAGSGLWIDEDHGFRWPLGFMQDGERLPEAQTVFLLRTVMLIACEPGSIGAMSSGVSPLDPIFWVLHPTFEKALHIVHLAPRYAETYSFDWVSGSCSGSAYTDELPFTEKWLGLGDGTKFLTNEELVSLFHPSNNRLPYLYDNFKSWGTCHDWDPCPECTESMRI